MVLRDKHIILGVTGGIAAYKSALLVRELRRHGAEVRVVMTPAAEKFVGAATFQGLSGYPVETGIFDGPQRAAANAGEDPDAVDDGMRHIALSRWADFLLIAPASANSLAKMAHGHADDLPSAIYLAGDVPTAVVPAMNHLMWQHPATRDNLEVLQRRDVRVWGPVEGDQACGETGDGRMLEPAEIARLLSGVFSRRILTGHKVVISAGPTCEAIDAVRYLTNASSGKMGFALASAARACSENVVLIAGPVSLPTPPGVRRIDVVTTEQMCAAVFEQVENAAMYISCAAVADYRPLNATPAAKLKKCQQLIQLPLIRTRDILAEASTRHPHLFLVGFAAETHDVAVNAKSKLLSKNLDMIVANRVGPEAEHGFGSDDAAVDVYWRGGSEPFDAERKGALSEKLMALFVRQYQLKAGVGARKDTA